MMLAKAVAKYVKLSPKKARLVTRSIAGLTVVDAYGRLAAINKKASRPIADLVRSAFENARRKDHTVTEHDLFISKITADGGPFFKRFRAASMGRASMIRKRTAHLAVYLDRKAETASKPKRAVKEAKK